MERIEHLERNDNTRSPETRERIAVLSQRMDIADRDRQEMLAILRRLEDTLEIHMYKK